MKPSGIVSFYNVPADAEDPDVKVYVNDELVEIGGGGSSDFTTATVTTDVSLPFVLPICDDENSSLFASDYINTYTDPGTYKVPLYKGSLTVIPPSVVTAIIGTGDFEYSDGILNITGDCHITSVTGGDD